MRHKIFFRADAGAGIGYGHFIRSLALADMLKSDFECVMFTQEPTPYQISEAEKVCPLVSLPADESKFEKFLEYLTGEEIVVLDNYFYTTEYQQQIKGKGCKLVCIDDVYDKHFVADVVLNHSVGLNRNDYDVEPYTKVCLGAEFLLLRRPFREASEARVLVNSPIRTYFICFGGSDEFDFTSRTSQIILDQNAENKVVAIVGDSYLGELEKIKDQYNERICVAKNLSAEEMCGLMQSCDAAIVPASSVFFEVCCTRKPILSGYYVDNQINVACETAKMGLCIGLGDLTESFESKLKEGLGKLKDNVSAIVRSQTKEINNSEPNIKKLFMDLMMDESYIKLPISREEFLEKVVETLEITKNPLHPLVFFNGIESCEIGKDVYIGYMSEVNARGAKVVLGDRCDIASFVSINVADSHKRCVGISDSIERGDIILEHDVFVGSHCFIGGGCHIGHHSVVAAGTILIKGGDIPPYSLVKGNPAVITPNLYKR